MAAFNLDGRTKVKNLKANFKDNFGASLRIYTTIDCKELADDEATLASIRVQSFAGGDIEVKGNMKVSSFEKRLAVLCDDFSYGCTSFPTFNIKGQDIIKTIKDILNTYVPF